MVSRADSASDTELLSTTWASIASRRSFFLFMEANIHTKKIDHKMHFTGGLQINNRRAERMLFKLINALVQYFEIIGFSPSA